MEAIRSSSKEALTELRETLGVFRGDAETGPLAPFVVTDTDPDDAEPEPRYSKAERRADALMSLICGDTPTHPDAADTSNDAHGAAGAPATAGRKVRPSRSRK